MLLLLTRGRGLWRYPFLGDVIPAATNNRYPGLRRSPLVLRNLPPLPDYWGFHGMTSAPWDENTTVIAPASAVCITWGT